MNIRKSKNTRTSDRDHIGFGTKSCTDLKGRGVPEFHTWKIQTYLIHIVNFTKYRIRPPSPFPTTGKKNYPSDPTYKSFQDLPMYAIRRFI